MTLMEIPALTAALAGTPGVHRAGHGRLQVHVEAPTFAAAVTLVTEVAAAAEELDHHPDVDLRYREVTFTLATHSAGGVTELDVELGRRIVALATAGGATLLPLVDRVEVAIDAVDGDALKPFWRAGLGYVEQFVGEESELRHPGGAGPVVWFQAMDPARTERSRIHLDVYVAGGQEAAEQRVAAAIAAGGRLVSDAHAPSWWVLADAEGNELCVCQP